jgi:hypothetical protein
MGKLKAIIKGKKLEKQQVTQETIDDHREVILTKAKKFKGTGMTMQRRIVTIAVGLAAMIALVSAGIGYVSLYVLQSTGDVSFRLTKVIPVPVGVVAGDFIRYSDYLLVYRSSIAPIEKQSGKLGDDEGAEMQRNHYKRQAMDFAIRYTYAKVLARELGVTVEKSQIEEAFRDYRTVDGKEWSEEAFEKAIYDNLGLTRKEYEELVRMSLLIKNVSVAVDSQASAKAEEVAGKIGAGVDFVEIGAKVEGVTYEKSNGLMDVMSIDGGRTVEALKLEVGGVSEKFVSKAGDGYYFVKALSRDGEKVEYASIFIPFAEFGRRLDEVKNDGGVSEFIKIDVVE